MKKSKILADPTALADMIKFIGFGTIILSVLVTIAIPFFLIIPAGIFLGAVLIGEAQIIYMLDSLVHKNKDEATAEGENQK